MPGLLSRLKNKILRNASGSASKFDPKKTLVKRIGYAFIQGGGSGRAQAEAPEFDLNEVDRAYNSDSYVRQAIDKYVDLIFKAGWDLKSQNQKALEYLNLRLQMIEESTRVPWEQLITDIAEDLVKYGNAFIVKARAKSGKGVQIPGVNATGWSADQPIAGYFVLPATTIKIARDKNGNIKRYEQEVPGGGKPKKFKPEDVIHMYYKKPRGRAFGVPYLLPVVDDIKLLREIEENVARLIYRHLHPLYKFKVGLDKAGFEATEEEILAMRNQIDSMPSDGAMVLSERHDIEVIGAQRDAIKAEPYLRYFEQRVFTGLGVPEHAMGRGETANRSTADAMTVEMHDRVKAFQRILSMFISAFMVKELLLEGGFNPIENPEDQVQFEFKEIAQEEKIKKETFELLKFQSNGQTFEEYREAIGMNPDTDESRLWVNMIGSVEAQNSAASRPANSDGAKSATSSQNQPSNQNGTKSGPKRKSESFTESSIEHRMNQITEALNNNLGVETYKSMYRGYYKAVREDVMDLARSQYKEDKDMSDRVDGVFELAKKQIKTKASTLMQQAFNKGINGARNETNVTRTPEINNSMAMLKLNRQVEKDINRLMNNVRSKVKQHLKLKDRQEALQRISVSFETSKYRVDFGIKYQLARAYNYGYALTAKALDRDSVRVVSAEAPCKECGPRIGDEITIDGDIYDKLPPFHPNCTCELEMVE